MPQESTGRELRYLNKDFGAFRKDLIEYAKQYYPNTYNDFNESSPGMMFIEMASYVGDVLSYYLDSQFKETLLAYAEDTKTLFEMAQSFGYKPKLSSASFTNVDVFQIVPSKGSGTSVRPDYSYAVTIGTQSTLLSNSGTTFRIREPINFSYSSSYDPTEVSVYENDGTNPTFYLLKKSVGCISGEIKEEQFTFGNAERYSRVILGQTNILEIISCTDSDGNTWREVPFLAQDTVFDSIENTATNDPTLVQYNDTAPYLLKLLKTGKRFVTFIRGDGRTEVRFGAGESDFDEEIVPNPNNVGSSLPGSPSYLDTYFDPTNFLKTQAYGQAPANTTLTIKYTYGGGIGDNVVAGGINSFSDITINLDETGLNSGLVTTVKDSIAVNNPFPSTGGKSSESIKELKENALAYFQSQGRTVTKEDYILRAYAMPPKFGAISKAYIVQDEQLNIPSMQEEVKANLFIDDRNRAQLRAQDAKSAERVPNPLALNMYTLGYTGDKKLTQVNLAVKENLKKYISQYRLMTDAVNIKNAWIINIGVKFNFICRAGFNKEEVTLRCINKVTEFFNIDRWQINQPIIIAELAYELSIVDGVGAIVPPTLDNPKQTSVLIYNKYRSADGYSGNIYDIDYATKDGIVYPSLDPSIFELKYPALDIEGKAIGDSIGNTL